MIFLKSTIFVDDEPTLNHVPYLGDGVNEDIFSELYDTKKRERLYEFGPPYQEKETLETIDDVLKLMAVQKPHLFDDVALFHETVAASAAVVTSEGNNMPSDNGNESDTAAATENKVPITPGQLHVKLLRRIHVLVAELTNVDLERVHERHSACFVRDDGRPEDVDKRFRTSSFSGEHFVLDARSNDDKRTRTSSFSEDHANTNCHNKAAAGPAASKGAATIPYPMLMDSYRSLFCRRCFTYDCAIHGNLPQASLDLLGELAVQKEKDGHWKDVRYIIYLEYNHCSPVQHDFHLTISSVV